MCFLITPHFPFSLDWGEGGQDERGVAGAKFCWCLPNWTKMLNRTLLLSCVGLSACMVGPNYHEPPKKIENHWLQSPHASTPLSQPAGKQAQWWYLFNDPTLTFLINLGYQNNLSLMGAGVRVLQAIIDVAVAGAKTRFRPILMTSLAFILGVMPLVFASGTGANARRSIGISVASGMLASTCLAVVFVPSFYVLIQTWFEKKKAKKQNVLLIK
jgi:hypothetical protein